MWGVGAALRGASVQPALHPTRPLASPGGVPALGARPARCQHALAATARPLTEGAPCRPAAQPHSQIRRPRQHVRGGNGG